MYDEYEPVTLYSKKERGFMTDRGVKDAFSWQVKVSKFNDEDVEADLTANFQLTSQHNGIEPLHGMFVFNSADEDDNKSLGKLDALIDQLEQYREAIREAMTYLPTNEDKDNG